MDNLYESGRYEFHDTALRMISHLTHDNKGEDPPSLSLELPEGTVIQLPDNYAIVPHIDQYAGDITLSSIGRGAGRPTFTENHQTRVPEEAWPTNLYKVSLIANVQKISQYGPQLGFSLYFMFFL